MKKIILLIVILLLTGCTGSKMANKQQVLDYCSGFYEDAYNYISELDYSSSDIIPETIEVSLYAAEKSYLKTNRTFKEVLDDKYPVLQIDLRREGKTYTEEEIDEVVRLAQKKGDRINIIFDGDDYTIYEISSDSIMILVTTPKDKGASASRKEYK